MKYVVDGYNLIGAIRSISFTDPQKEEKLKQFILKRWANKSHQFLLVFDGKNPHYEYGFEHSNQEGIAIYFTAYGQTADGYMIDFVETTKQKSGIVVVTSDREIQKSAKSAKFIVQSAKDFLAAYDNREDPEEQKPVEDDMGFWLNQFNGDSTA